MLAELSKFNSLFLHIVATSLIDEKVFFVFWDVIFVRKYIMTRKSKDERDKNLSRLR